MKVDNFNLSRWIIHITRGVTWMVLFTPAYRYASAQSGIQQPENANGLYTNLDPSMAIVILVLISTIFIVAIFSLYVRHCSDSSAAVDFSGKGGLDPAVIQTFPIFIYSAVKHLKIGKGALECAVCLSEFVDDDTLRLIPKCEHVFHPDCIDTWLASHVTCPVCRAKLTPEPNQKVKSTESNELNQNQNDSGSEQSEEQNRVVIDINVEQSSSEAQVCEIANTSQVNRPTRLGIPEKLPRSNSTGHLLVQSGVNVERYTMRLSEEVRKQLMMSGKLKPTVSFNTVLAREGSSLKGGYGSGGAEGSSRGRN